jgi:hypothetical protein
MHSEHNSIMFCVGVHRCIQSITQLFCVGVHRCTQSITQLCSVWVSTDALRAGHNYVLCGYPQMHSEQNNYALCGCPQMHSEQNNYALCGCPQTHTERNTTAVNFGPFRLPDISETVCSSGHWQLHTECEFFLHVSKEIV